MPLVLRGLLLWGIALSLSNQAQAQWFSGAIDHVKQVFHNNNAWPKPFVFEDRKSVAQTMLIQQNNGWRRQNLLCDYHFDEETAKLTSAGEIKLRWILNQPNADRRTVFLQKAPQAELTAARLDSVQLSAVRMLPRGELPQIVETNMDTPYVPAEDVDSTFVQYNNSIAVPRLPGRTTTASSGSASSGGSGGSSSGSANK
jgi:hypothetical protein